MITPRVLVWLVLVLLWGGARPAAAQDDVSWLHQQINALRGNLGVHGYALNGALMAAAQSHSEWMASVDRVAHTQDNGSTPGDRARAAGYGGRLVSENVYAGYNASAETAFNWWLSSEIHYAGMVNPDKTDLGIGVAQNGPMRYYTLVFGYGSGGGAPPPPPEPALDPIEIEPPIEPAEVAAQAPIEAAPVQQAAQPTQPPPPPPAATFTPSPTIPTRTPTTTWTPTFTWTPSPTVALPTPTGTPIVLPTAAPLQEIALLPSPTPLRVQLAPLQKTPQEVAVSLPPNSTPPTDQRDGFSLRPLLALLIGVQVVGIGWVLWRLARKI